MHKAEAEKTIAVKSMVNIMFTGLHIGQLWNMKYYE